MDKVIGVNSVTQGCMYVCYTSSSSHLGKTADTISKDALGWWHLPPVLPADTNVYRPQEHNSSYSDKGGRKKLPSLKNRVFPFFIS